MGYARHLKIFMRDLPKYLWTTRIFLLHLVPSTIFMAQFMNLGKKRNSSERKSHMNSSQESKALHQLPLPLGLENLSQMKNNINNSTTQYRQVKPEILIP